MACGRGLPFADERLAGARTSISMREPAANLVFGFQRFRSSGYTPKRLAIEAWVSPFLTL